MNNSLNRCKGIKTTMEDIEEDLTFISTLTENPKDLDNILLEMYNKLVEVYPEIVILQEEIRQKMNEDKLFEDLTQST